MCNPMFSPKSNTYHLFSVDDSIGFKFVDQYRTECILQVAQWHCMLSGIPWHRTGYLFFQ